MPSTDQAAAENFGANPALQQPARGVDLMNYEPKVFRSDGPLRVERRSPAIVCGKITYHGSSYTLFFDGKTYIFGGDQTSNQLKYAVREPDLFRHFDVDFLCIQFEDDKGNINPYRQLYPKVIGDPDGMNEKRYDIGELRTALSVVSDDYWVGNYDNRERQLRYAINSAERLWDERTLSFRAW